MENGTLVGWGMVASKDLGIHAYENGREKIKMKIKWIKQMLNKRETWLILES